MKLESATKLDKRYKTTSKKIDNNITLIICSVIVFFFSIYTLFEAIRKPDSESIKLTFSQIVIFHLTKTENRAKKYHTIALSKNTVLTLLL